MKIGIDIMGGDFAPNATLNGAILAQKELSPSDRLYFFGKKDVITAYLADKGVPSETFEIIDCPDVIEMGEHPTKALTLKPKSSIAVGFEMLKKKEIDAFASVGNTGAMLVGSIYSVGTIKGVLRPCTSTLMPKESGKSGIILDVGTNTDCKPDNLVQFGILGSLYAKYVFGIEKPKIGLLNVGEEEEKGNLLAQAAHKAMKENPEINFVGNIEGRDVFNDKADVIVCDGFTGNVVIKQAEAVYTMFKSKGFSGDFLENFNYEKYGGTPILGVNSTVIIGHGISNETAIRNLLLLTRDVHNSGLVEKIKSAMQSTLQEKI